jgi:hypothetical protein
VPDEAPKVAASTTRPVVELLAAEALRPPPGEEAAAERVARADRVDDLDGRGHSMSPRRSRPGRPRRRG